jgi:hypothetical protein
VRLGSVVLAAVLLGVPRVLEGRTFGGPRPVYVDVAAEAPELTDLTTELGRAIDGAAYSLTSGPSEATLVVELLGVTTARGADGRLMEAASFTIRDGARSRPLVLHYAPGQRARAARALVRELSPTPA